MGLLLRDGEIVPRSAERRVRLAVPCYARIWSLPPGALTAASTRSQLCESIERCGWCDWRGSQRPTAQELHGTLSRIDCNCFGCYRNDADDEPCGEALYLGATDFNHSCTPSARRPAVKPRRREGEREGGRESGREI